MVQFQELISGIMERTHEILSLDFSLSEPQSIPEVKDVGFAEAKTLNAVCLFADLRGSTSITAEKQKQSAVRIYRAYLDNTAEIIHHYGGHIRGIAGDSFLVLFRSEQNDADQAVRCAWAIQSAMTHIIAPEVRIKYGIEISVGIGIDMGTILAARAGKPYISAAQDLIWMSHAVNTASKLCGAALPAGVVVSDRVFSTMTEKTKNSSGGKPLGWQERFLLVAGEPIKVWAERGVYFTVFKDMGLYKEDALPGVTESPLLDPQEVRDLREALHRYAPSAFQKRIEDLKSQLSRVQNPLDRMLLIERMLEWYDFLDQVDTIATWPAKDLTFEKIRFLQAIGAQDQARQALRMVLQKFRWGDPDTLVEGFASSGLLGELIETVEADQWKSQNDYWILAKAYSRRNLFEDTTRAADALHQAAAKLKASAEFEASQFMKKLEDPKLWLARYIA